MLQSAVEPAFLGVSNLGAQSRVSTSCDNESPLWLARLQDLLARREHMNAQLTVMKIEKAK
jgi:sulfur transfer complex TusBCD TusB component (DsrH family)